MIYRLAVQVAAVVVFAIFVPGALTPPAVALDPEDLAAVRGGIEQVCSAPIHDPAGVDCDECTSDGNGGSVECDSTHLDRKHFYVAGQEPAAYVYDYVETDCEGTAFYFESTGCGGMPWATPPCDRQYTAGNFVRLDYGINCP